MIMVRYIVTVCAVLLIRQAAWCGQRDTIPPPANDTIPGFIKGSTTVPQPKARPKDSPYKTDSATRKKHDPRRATLYSTFLPGLGQFYNKKYWKLPLVGAALGIPAYSFFYNRKEYNTAQFAIGVIARFFTDTNTTVPTIPPGILAQVDPRMRNYVINGEDNPLRSYRNYVRKNEDYSVLFFMLFWGLQIVDATVDAHLKEFDVSDNLSMRLGPSDGSQTRVPGLSLVFDLHSSRYKSLPLP
jgi:hypothetical protein